MRRRLLIIKFRSHHFVFSNAAPAWKDQLDWSTPDLSESTEHAPTLLGAIINAGGVEESGANITGEPDIISTTESEVIAAPEQDIVAAQAAAETSVQAIADIWNEKPKPQDHWSNFEVKKIPRADSTTGGGKLGQLL